MTASQAENKIFLACHYADPLCLKQWAENQRHQLENSYLDTDLAESARLCNLEDI